MCHAAVVGGNVFSPRQLEPARLGRHEGWLFYFSLLNIVRGGEVTCLPAESDFRCFLLMERGSLAGETKSCVCLGFVDLALSPGESRVQCKGELAPGSRVQ